MEKQVDIAPGTRANERSRTSPIWTLIRKNLNEITLLLGLIGVSAFITANNDVFLSPANLINVLRSAAFLGIVTWGMTLVIIAGEIDVSVGPAVAFASVLLGWLVTNNSVPLGLGAILVVAVTTVVGLTAGYVRARFNVPSFVTSLALWSIYDGMKQVMSNNIPIPVDDEAFSMWGRGDLLGIPYPIIIAGVLFLIFVYISTHTVYGRSIYAVGGNAKAAYAAGINVLRTRASVFAVTGALAGLTGLLHVSRLGSATGQVASGLEFSSIAAVVIGGTALSGGRGKMIGSLIGVLFISVIANGLVLMGVNSQAQNVVRGVLILIAVLVNVVFKRESKEI
ncbi:MAG: ABC transporter permease [Chloroflexi bacterium]|nr:ABC transporter permease [Chloroflexota bacterium]